MRLQFRTAVTGVLALALVLAAPAAAINSELQLVPARIDLTKEVDKTVTIPPEDAEGIGYSDDTIHLGTCDASLEQLERLEGEVTVEVVD